MLKEQSTTTEKTDPFKEAEIKWDLERLHADLAKVKGASLSPVEQLHLRGLLCGHSSAELAGMRVRDTRGLQSEVCKTVRHYVKELMGQIDVGGPVPKRMSSEKMLEVLNIAGYGRQLRAFPEEKTLPIDALEGLIKIVGNGNHHSANMRVEIRLVTSITAEEIIKLLTNSKTAEEIVKLLTHSQVDSSQSEKK